MPVDALKHYDALMQQIRLWAVEETLGKGKMPTRSQDLDAIATRYRGVRERSKMFHVEPDRHVKQSWFLKAMAPVVIAHTGNKFGKTFALLIRGLIALLGCCPWDPENSHLYNPIKFAPPVKVTLIVQDYNTAVPEDIIPRLKEIMPWDALVTRTSRVVGQVIDGIEFWNGSTLKILSHIQPAERYEGWSTHLCLWNEPFPRSIWVPADRGCLEYGAPHLMAFTPISEAWIHDELFVPGLKVRCQEDFDKIATEKPEIVVIEGSIYDNPYMPEDARERFIRKLSPMEREARIHGTWQQFAGMVYKGFSEARHVRQLADLV